MVKRDYKLKRFLIMALTVIMVCAMLSVTAFAEDIFDVADVAIRDFYGNLIGLSTLLAIVAETIALILYFVSPNQRTVDNAKTWAIRILQGWVLINSLGFIVAYIVPLFEGGTTIPGMS